MDNVHKPAHYNASAIECIDAIEAMLGPEGFVAYCQGNVIKYNWRVRHKGTPKEDFAKAKVYAGWAEAGTARGRQVIPPAHAAPVDIEHPTTGGAARVAEQVAAATDGPVLNVRGAEIE